jgi:hypothetical protein
MSSAGSAGWVEMSTDDGRPFYVNSSGVTSWTMPKSIKASKLLGNPHWPWTEMLSDDGAPYYWNQETDETLWDRPEGWEDGEPARGKKWGPWTECVGKDGAYFWNEETGETRWEIPEGELREIERQVGLVKEEERRMEEDRKAAEGSGGGYVGASPPEQGPGPLRAGATAGPPNR